MKKLIIMISALTITSTVAPLTIACKTSSKSSNQRSNSTGKDYDDKFKNAKATLTNFEDLKIAEAKIDKLKNLIKAKIEHNLDKKDGVTVENTLKVTKKNEIADLKDNDITVNELEITVTGQFKSGSLAEQFTLNTKVKLVSSQTLLSDAVKLLNDIQEETVELTETDLTVANLNNAIKKLDKYTSIVNGEVSLKKDFTLKRQDGSVLDANDKISFNDIVTVEGEIQVVNLSEKFVFTVKVIEERGIDLSTINADMIINWQSEYLIGNDRTEYISIESEKLGSLKNSDIELVIKNNVKRIIQHKISGIDKTKLNDVEINDIKKYNFNDLNATEKLNFVISDFIITFLVDYEIKTGNEENSKKFSANIEIKKWNEVNKNNQLKTKLNNFQSYLQSFLNKSDEDKKAAVSNSDMNVKEIEAAVSKFNEIAKTRIKMSLESIKTMYDFIKGTSKTVEVDLTTKQ